MTMDTSFSTSKTMNNEPHKQQSSDARFGLKRELGLSGGVSFIMGVIIGSGIFISPKGVLAGTGSVGLCLILWTICGFISMCGAINLVELGTMLPRAGGSYIYMLEAYGGPVAYLSAWTTILLVRPAALAIISLTSAEYIMAGVFNDGCGMAPTTLRKLTAATFLITICAINIYSVKLANRLNVVFAAVKILSLCIIIFAGFVKLGQGFTQNFSNAFENTESSFSRIALGFYGGMWAFDGWSNLNTATEEIINPNRNLPGAIFISIPFITVIYVLVNISYFTVLSPEALLASPAVVVSWADEVMPNFSWIFPIFVAVSTFGAAHGTLFAGARSILAAAREGHMMNILCMANVESYTPLPSVAFTTILSVLMIIPSDIGILLNVFSFAAWLFNGLTALSVIVLRWKLKNVHRPYKVPLVFPCIMVAVSAYLVIGPIVEDPQIEFLYAFLGMLSGLLLYVPLVHFKLSPPFMGAMTKWLQLLMQVAPTKFD